MRLGVFDNGVFGRHDCFVCSVKRALTGRQNKRRRGVPQTQRAVAHPASTAINTRFECSRSCSQPTVPLSLSANHWPLCAPDPAAMSTDASNESFVVAVRVRPPNSRELANDSHRDIVKICSSNVLCFDPRPDADDAWAHSAKKRPRQIAQRYAVMCGACEAASPGCVFFPGAHCSLFASLLFFYFYSLRPRSREKDLRLAFDCVLPPNSTQDDVYQNTAKRLVSSVMEGYNASCFAYGATGAGKTCTMIGNEIVGPGVMVLTMRDIFDQVLERVRASFALICVCAAVAVVVAALGNRVRARFVPSRRVIFFVPTLWCRCTADCEAIRRHHV